LVLNPKNLVDLNIVHSQLCSTKILDAIPLLKVIMEPLSEITIWFPLTTTLILVPGVSPIFRSRRFNPSPASILTTVTSEP